MTWTQLEAHVKKMDKEQANTDVTIFDSNIGEFFAATTIHFATEDDALDVNHPFLYIAL